MTATLTATASSDLFASGRASFEGFADESSPEAQSYRESKAHFDMLLGPLKAFVQNPSRSIRDVNGRLEVIPGTTNIEVTQEGLIFVEEFGREKRELEETMPAMKREALIGFMANSSNSGTVTRLSSRLACDMPYYDARVQAFGPPVGFWTLIIRMHGPLLDLDYYERQGIITPRQRGFFRECLAAPKRERPNIAIFGSVDTGKSTMLGAFGEEMRIIAPTDRQIIIQDRREIKSSARNKEFLFFDVEQAHYETNNTVSRYRYDAIGVLEDYLRANGTRVLFGEVRTGLAARGLMLAMNTGAGGLVTTGHSDGAEDGMYRIEDLLRVDGYNPVRRMMARFVGVILYMEKDEKTGKRSVREVLRVHGVDANDDYVLERVA
jgi:Flp pilus assembly CpaF family ATPase